MQATLLSAVLLLSSASTAEEWPRETTFTGPAEFCGWHFKATLAPKENLIVRDGGLDFLVYYFEGGPTQYTIYEGMAASFEKEKSIDAGLNRRTKRVWVKDFPSYLIKMSSKRPIFYAHIMSPSFKGTSEDFKLLRSIAFGDQRDTGCTKPTYTKRP